MSFVVIRKENNPVVYDHIEIREQLYHVDVFLKENIFETLGVGGIAKKIDLT